MPRIIPNRKKYMIQDIGSWVSGQLAKAKKEQKDLAAAMGITQQGLSYKIRNNAFTYADLLTIFEFFATEGEQIVNLMKV